MTAFLEALQRLGWADGQNLRIEDRYAASNPTLFNSYAEQLVAWAPTVILAITGPAAAALQQQTRIIPIVFILVPDPVGLGFVRSLAETLPGSVAGMRPFWVNGWNC
jgi:putative tryptophan/tyrosine transport system substrate-binding protein